jgi:hypothetical protein
MSGSHHKAPGFAGGYLLGDPSWTKKVFSRQEKDMIGFDPSQLHALN